MMMFRNRPVPVARRHDNVALQPEIEVRDGGMGPSGAWCRNSTCPLGPGECSHHADVHELSGGM